MRVNVFFILLEVFDIILKYSCVLISNQKKQIKRELLLQLILQQKASDFYIKSVSLYTIRIACVLICSFIFISSNVYAQSGSKYDSTEKSLERITWNLSLRNNSGNCADCCGIYDFQTKEIREGKKKFVFYSDRKKTLSYGEWNLEKGAKDNLYIVIRFNDQRLAPGGYQGPYTFLQYYFKPEKMRFNERIPDEKLNLSITKK